MHTPAYRVIHLHAQAPPKPALGKPCNGCGVCCASEPCPVGILVSGRRHGACAALVWREEARVYRCAMIEEPAAHLPATLRWTAPLVARLARRFVAAGIGCDSDVETEPG